MKIVEPGRNPTQDQDGFTFEKGAENNGQVVTAGGRVLCVVGLGSSVSEAQAKAYELTQQITWDKVYYRRDIGYRAVDREQKG